MKIHRKWLLVLILLLSVSKVALGNSFHLLTAADQSSQPSFSASADSYSPILTPDGNFVLFTSAAENLCLTTNNTSAVVPALRTMNVFLRDRTNETTDRNLLSGRFAVQSASLSLHPVAELQNELTEKSSPADGVSAKSEAVGIAASEEGDYERSNPPADDPWRLLGPVHLCAMLVGFIVGWIFGMVRHKQGTLQFLHNVELWHRWGGRERRERGKLPCHATLR